MVMDFEFELKDIKKRLYSIENSLFQMVDVIDIAKKYEDRLINLEDKFNLKGNNQMSTELPVGTKPKPLTETEVKQNLMLNVNSLYMNLISFIRKMPLDQKLMDFAIQNLDQGLMWVDQAVKALRFEVTEIPKSDVTTPEEPPKEVNESECLEAQGVE